MSGHFVYGLLTRKKIRSSGEVVFAIALSEKLSETIPVNENSIAQLVGYDKDGKEIFEGDIVQDETRDNRLFPVEFKDAAFCFHGWNRITGDIDFLEVVGHVKNEE